MKKHPQSKHYVMRAVDIIPYCVDIIIKKHPQSKHCVMRAVDIMSYCVYIIMKKHPQSKHCVMRAVDIIPCRYNYKETSSIKALRHASS